MAQYYWLVVLVAAPAYSLLSPGLAQGRERAGVTRARQAGRASPTHRMSSRVAASELFRKAEKAMPTLEKRRSTVAEVAGQPRYCAEPLPRGWETAPGARATSEVQRGARPEASTGVLYGLYVWGKGGRRVGGGPNVHTRCLNVFRVFV